MKIRLYLCAMTFALASSSFASILFSNFPDPLYGGNYLAAPDADSPGVHFGISIDDHFDGGFDLDPGRPPPSMMDWNISSNPQGVGTIASGSSSLSNAFVISNPFYDIYESTFSLPGIFLDRAITL